MKTGSIRNKIVLFPFLLLIKLYQWLISPMLGANCRFTPSCSQYALEAFQKYGIIRGFVLSFKRLTKCHPWGSHGVDPVP